MQNAKCRMWNAECKMQNAECESEDKMENAECESEDKMENVIEIKSFEFSVRIINLYKYLMYEKRNMFFPSSFFVVEQA